MRGAGIRVWHLDEEGGIYLGNDEDAWQDFLSRRFDPRLLNQQDKILAWGDWQADFFKSQKLSAPVHMVGHTNFDIYRPQYADALRAFDVGQTGGKQDYILINTRFAISNAPVTGDVHIINSSIVRDFFDQSLLFEKLVADGHLYYDFIIMIFNLATRLPHRKIVLRPHPAEDSSSYRRIFAALKNVHVTGEGDAGSWIRLASCVIHNGCTTAIQATIAEKLVITYAPRPEDDRTTACLPNRTGVIAEDLDTLIRLVDSEQSIFDRGQWKRTISTLDTVDRLTEMVNGNIEESGRSKTLPLARLLCIKFRVSETVRGLVRSILPKKKSHFKHRMALFDPAFFNKIASINESAHELYSSDIECIKLDQACYAFKMRNR
tara:strand:- start:2637 stop:3767 length:1131 start_codon:yes stop_codon:yes gene_type:complete